MKFLGLLILVLFGSVSNAQWSFRPQAGMGFTDNANYEDSGKDSDLFFWVRSSNSFQSGSNHYNLWLNYRAYAKETQNNVFSYRFGDTMSLRTRSLGDFDWDLGIGGQQYTQGSPGTTEETFDNVYAETAATKIWSLQNNLEMSLEPQYQLKYFSKFDGRTDHSLLLNFTTDWQFDPIQSLNPFSEIGFVFSNQSIFTKNYLEFGTDWRILPQPDLKYIVHFVSRYSAFPSRQISESTVISDKRGRTRATSQNEIETQSLIQIQGSVVKILKKAELRGSLGFTSQSSRSGYEDYSEAQIQGSVLVPF